MELQAPPEQMVRGVESAEIVLMRMLLCYFYY